MMQPTKIYHFDAKRGGAVALPLVIIRARPPGGAGSAPEALHVISSALPLYHTCGWIASLISEALPPLGGDGRGGEGRLNL